MKKIIVAIALSSYLFSVPVFAVGMDTENSIVEPQIYGASSDSDILIQNLNTEFDRLSANGYNHEDYDLLSESGTNLVIDAVLPMNGVKLSDTQIREYLIWKLYIAEELERYSAEIKDDPERAVFFEHAATFIRELIYAD